MEDEQTLLIGKVMNTFGDRTKELLIMDKAIVILNKYLGDLVDILICI